MSPTYKKGAPGELLEQTDVQTVVHTRGNLKKAISYHEAQVIKLKALLQKCKDLKIEEVEEVEPGAEGPGPA